MCVFGGGGGRGLRMRLDKIAIKRPDWCYLCPKANHK